MKLSLEILYTSIKDDGLSYGENRTCLAILVFEIYRKQKIVGMWLINFVTHGIRIVEILIRKFKISLFDLRTFQIFTNFDLK